MMACIGIEELASNLWVMQSIVRMCDSCGL